MTTSFEIKRADDGTRLGKYKATPEGKLVSEVLEVIFNQYGLDGSLLMDDSTYLTKSDLLTAGCTYRFRPSINVLPPGELRGKVHGHLQEFVASAAKSYRRWEISGNDNFMVMSADPLPGVIRPSLLWIRKSYQSLKEIISKAETTRCWKILLQCFFFISYLAAQSLKVVWKLGGGFYVLDFSSAPGTCSPALSEFDPQVQDVLVDSTAWLIIDGKQRAPLHYSCRILLACSTRSENYHHFCKHPDTVFLYCPAWSESEIEGFLDDFQPRRVDYQPWVSQTERRFWITSSY